MKPAALVFACLAFAFAAAAHAQDFTPTREAIDAETRGSVFPGFRQGQTRPVWVWRPPSAPANAVLPVIYMADGMGGVYTVVGPIRAAIASGAMQPILVVALEANSDPETRAAEYLRGWSGGSDDYTLHERWFLEQVIPWAERTQRASHDRAQRFVGGFSNGADFALSIASAHPDIFAGALVHSPVGANAGWVADQAPTQRWVITGGTREQGGTLERAGNLPREIAQALERARAPLRVCIGPWAHNGRSWRDVTPGSLAWLMNVGDPAALSSPREQSSCQNSP